MALPFEMTLGGVPVSQQARRRARRHAWAARLRWRGPDTIPGLWPEEFKVDVQTPCAILNVQAGQSGRVTKGILRH